jgi:hypothetical protein
MENAAEMTGQDFIANPIRNCFSSVPLCPCGELRNWMTL